MSQAFSLLRCLTNLLFLSFNRLCLSSIRALFPLARLVRLGTNLFLSLPWLFDLSAIKSLKI